jgi:hypothetical protein
VDARTVYHIGICRENGEKTTSHHKPQGASDEVVKLKAMQHADIRLTCGSHVVGCVLWHLKLFLAAREPPKTGFEPRLWTGHRLSEIREFR